MTLAEQYLSWNEQQRDHVLMHLGETLPHNRIDDSEEHKILLGRCALLLQTACPDQRNRLYDDFGFDNSGHRLCDNVITLCDTILNMAVFQNQPWIVNEIAQRFKNPLPKHMFVFESDVLNNIRNNPDPNVSTREFCASFSSLSIKKQVELFFKNLSHIAHTVEKSLPYNTSLLDILWEHMAPHIRGNPRQCYFELYRYIDDLSTLVRNHPTLIKQIAEIVNLEEFVQFGASSADRDKSRWIAFLHSGVWPQDNGKEYNPDTAQGYALWVYRMSALVGIFETLKIEYKIPQFPGISVILREQDGVRDQQFEQRWTGQLLAQAVAPASANRKKKI